MKVDVLISPSELSSVDLRGMAVVVVDVLRATSTIVTALANGAAEVVPVETPEEALRYRLGDPAALACGERGGKPVEGFDLGNSPLEYTPERVEGRRIYLTTTNGTEAIRKAFERGAGEVLIGAFLNLSSVCDELRRRGRDIALICAGKEGRAGLEDLVFCGRCIERLGDEAELTDGAVIARIVSRSFADVKEALLSSQHGRYLVSIGFERDIDFCAREDLFDLLPTAEPGDLIRITASPRCPTAPSQAPPRGCRA